MSDYQQRASISNIPTKSYTVRIGDTIALVATRFDTTPSEIASINKLTSTFIYPGQHLLVPEKLDRVDQEEEKDDSTSIPTDKTRKLSIDDQEVRPIRRPTAPQVVVQPNFGPEPTAATCFNCRNVIVTRTTESANALCCFMFGLWSLCCPGCQDVEHRCPRCNVILGTYKAA